MANTISAYIKLYGAQKAKTELTDFTRGVQGLKESANRTANGMLLFGGAFATAAGLVTKAAVSQAAAMEQTRTAFTTLLKSGSAATAMLRDLARFSASTPFEFGEVTTAAKQLMAFGFQAQEIIPMLRDLGDATGALGIGAEGMQRLIFSLGQMKARGKITGEEIRELGHAGIPVMEILAEKLGVTQKELQKIATSGISADKALAALREGMRERFGGGMEAQARTFNGILSNLRDRLNLFWSDAEGNGVGDKILANIKPAFEEVYKELQKMADNGKLAEFARQAGRAIADVVRSLANVMKWFAKHPDVAAWGVKVGAAAGAVSLFGGAILKLGTIFTTFFGWLGQAVKMYKDWKAAADAAKVASEAAAAASAGSGAAGAAGAAGSAAGTAAGTGAGAVLRGITPWLGGAVSRFFLPAAVPVTLYENWKNEAGHRQARRDNETIRVEQFGGGDWNFDPRNPAKGGWQRRSGWQGGDRWIVPTGAYAALPYEQWGRLEAYLKRERAGKTPKGTGQASLSSIYYATNKGKSPGAEKAAPPEIAEWARVESRTVERNVRDYLTTRYGKAAAAAFTVTNRDKGAHARYKALDAVTTNPKALSWEMLSEALTNAGGLFISNEVGKANHSKNATGDHLHAYVPTEGQKTAAADTEQVAQEAKTASDDRARKLQAAAEAKKQVDRAGREAVAALYAMDETPFGQYMAALKRIQLDTEAGMEETKASKAAQDRIIKLATAKRKAAREAFYRAVNDAMFQAEIAALRATGDPKDALTADLKEIARERRQRLDALGNSPAVVPARLAIWKETRAREQAAQATYLDTVNRPYEDRAAQEAQAAQTYKQAAGEIAQTQAELTRQKVEDRAQEMRDDRTLTQAKIDNIAQELAAWYKAQQEKNAAQATDLRAGAGRLEMDGKIAEAAQARAQADALDAKNLQLAYEAERAVKRVRQDGADTLNRNAMDRLTLQRAELTNALALLEGERGRRDTSRDEYAIRKALYDLDVQMAKLRGEPAPPPPEPPITDDDRRREEWLRDWKAKARTVDSTLQEIPESFAQRFTDTLRGGSIKDAFKGFVDDLKRMFFRLVENLIAAWLKYEVSRVLISKEKQAEINAVEGQPDGAKGLLTQLAGGLIGGQKAGIWGGPSGTRGMPGVPLPGAPGGQGGALGGAMARLFKMPLGRTTAAGAFGAAMIGAAVAPLLFGRGNQSGLGGGLGAGIGMAVGGPIGGLVGGLIGGAIGSLFRKEKRPTGYTPAAFTDINTYALAAPYTATNAAKGATMPATASMGLMAAGKGAVPASQTITVNQTVHNYLPRKIDTYSRELADSVSRAVKARG